MVPVLASSFAPLIRVAHEPPSGIRRVPLCDEPANGAVLRWLPRLPGAE
jgi:hypothetical protein